MSDSGREWGEMTDDAIKARKARNQRAEGLDLGVPRLPEVSEYEPELWTVPKDAIYAAVEAIQLALSYMPQIKTDVPQFQKTVEKDVIQIQCALTQLRNLGANEYR